MEPWTKEKIEEAASFSWILYNKEDKPMVDGECFRCKARFQQESTEGNILPMYCPKCMTE